MPNRLILELGTNTYSIPLGGTVTQIRNMLTRVARFYVIATEGRTNQEVIEDILTQVKKDLRDRSVEIQRQDEIASRMADIQVIIETDNGL